VATQAEIVIDNDVVLDGEGNLIVQGSQGPIDYHRVFSVPPGVTVELARMTITGGGLRATAYGAGISSEGTLTLTSSSVVANTGSLDDFGWGFVYGGGISNTGVLVVADSVVSQNRTEGDGVGIYSTGSLTVVDSSIVENRGGNGSIGGGIYNFGGTATVVNSTVSLNFTDNWGSAILSTGGSLLLIGSTVSGNDADAGDAIDASSATIVNTTVSGNFGTAGAQIWAGDLTLINSTVVGKGESYGDEALGAYGEIRVTNTVIVSEAPCYFYGDGFITSLGGNIESPGDTCGFTDPTDLVNVTAAELNLGPLQDNGGPTETHALLPGSVAIDRIPPAMCVDADGQPLTEDQRGVARPQGAACDVGAFESVDCTGTACDDGNDCTADHCDPNDYAWCAYTTLADGTSCGVDGVCDAGACRERSWGTPVLIETDAIDPQVAVDPSGNAIAVWINLSATLSARSNRYTPSGGWGTAVPIEIGSGFGSQHPEVAVDPGGNAVTVWRRDDDGGAWSNRYTPSGGWGLAERFDAGGIYNFGPVVAVDPSGNAVVVWRNNQDVWSNRSTLSGGWGAAELIDNATRSAVDPEVAVDPDGNAVAVWRQSDGVGSLYSIWSSRYTPSGGWGAAEPIETNDAPVALGATPGPQVAIDGDGNATAVWLQSDGNADSVWSNRYTPSGGWGAAVLIENAPYPAFDQRVAVDPDGNAVAVWTQSDGNVESAWSNRYTPSGGWGTPVLIENDDTNRVLPGNGVDGGPQVAVDWQGKATAVWRQSDGNADSIWSNRYTPSGGWGTPVLIENDSEGLPNIRGGPQVAVDPDGNATAVWIQYVGNTPSIWSNRFE